MATATTAYYCIVQYTPSQYRAEAVNVGVVLYCPATQLLDAP